MQTALSFVLGLLLPANKRNEKNGKTDYENFPPMKFYKEN